MFMYIVDGQANRATQETKWQIPTQTQMETVSRKGSEAKGEGDEYAEKILEEPSRPIWLFFPRSPFFLDRLGPHRIHCVIIRIGPH